MPVKKQKTTTAAKASKPVQIFDVAPPGTLPRADATSRPVIVTNRPIMQDPMMTSPTTGQQPSSAQDEKSAKPSQKIVIRPLAEQAVETATSPTPDVTSTSGHDVDADGVIESGESEQQAGMKAPSGFPEPATTQTDTPAAADAASKTADTPVANEPTTHSEAAADQSPKPGENIEALTADKEAAQLAADAKVQDEIDGLVEEKTYFLPINSVVQRRSRHVFIFGTILILVLAAVWLDIALDAGFVTIPGLQPLTHIFRN